METPLSPFTFTPKPDWFEQYKYYLLAILLIIMTGGLYLILTPPKASLASDADTVLVASDESATSTIAGDQIVIDISGGVIKTGVYWLATGSIIEDAISSAGGFSRSADLDAVGKNINRAQELTNHGKVYIPKIGDTNIVYTNPSAGSSTSSSQTPQSLGDGETTSLININTADNAELDLLPGIGEILSQRIIDYRLQNGNFTSIDDLKKIAGINDSRFEQLKDLVTI
ncbi:MAG: ComEA family DNA-binding protein [Patescibacteria group bacterium]|jgi:competence protein ComEA